MSRFRSFLPVVLLLLIAGCGPIILFGAGTAAGIAGYKYYKGALTVIFEASFMETWNATLKTVEDMKLEIESSEHKISTGNIKAKYPDNTPLSISIEYRTLKETEVEIRVGLLGDKDASLDIKERIRKVLFSD
ncbi:MAG TPA: DUF3568 family protein [Desulfobacteraceae bacterium]|nr:DUF3568 family protein [Desulfobacteraceae bacterium]HPJ67625.1 DUF3568 family protein [Desulfobacteraceae bacterium]HPQ28569.1 DUF3568 family protein [Desulfobacteraceae bacterium]